MDNPHELAFELAKAAHNFRRNAQDEFADGIMHAVKCLGLTEIEEGFFLHPTEAPYDDLARSLALIAEFKSYVEQDASLSRVYGDFWKWAEFAWVYELNGPVIEFRSSEKPETPALQWRPEAT